MSYLLFLLPIAAIISLLFIQSSAKKDGATAKEAEVLKEELKKAEATNEAMAKRPLTDADFINSLRAKAAAKRGHRRFS